MPTATEIRPGGRAAYRYAARHWLVLVTIVVGCGVLLAGTRVLTSGSFVRHVNIANSSEYAIDVRVTDDPPEGWMPLGPAQPDKTTTFEEVYDQGRTWTLSFAYAQFEKSITVSRAELQNAGWRVDVPDDLIRELRSARVPATPDFAGS